MAVKRVTKKTKTVEDIIRATGVDRLTAQEILGIEQGTYAGDVQLPRKRAAKKRAAKKRSG